MTHYIPFSDIDYLEGDLNGQGGFDLGFGSNTWFDSAPTGTGSTVLAGNLNAPAGLEVSGNSVRTSEADFNLAFYTFDQNNDGANGVVGEDNLQAGEHWVSFLARADQGAFFAGLSFVKFFGPEILYIGKVSSTGSDRDNSGTVNGNDLLIIQRDDPLDPVSVADWLDDYGLTNTTAWGIDPQDGSGQIAAVGSDATVDTFLVAKLTIGAGANDDTIDLFINPDINGGTPTTPDLSVAFNEDEFDNRSIDEIRLGSQNGAFYTDEIRIGATFADVTPQTPALAGATVPEPTTLALIASVATLGLCVRRR
ncbi:MAG: PEP-CTERM sorting domain-containing protein [Planctomycetota bacterium]